MIVAFTGGRDYANKAMAGFVVDLVACCTTSEDFGSGNLKSYALDQRADLLIAFPGGAGTADCVRQAEKLGIPVLRVPT